MAQLLYELCFCLWSVSLCDETKQDFMSCGAIPILAQQVGTMLAFVSARLAGTAIFRWRRLRVGIHSRTRFS